MKQKSPSSPAKAAAARVNGRKGGTRSPDISRWNALRHALNAKKLSIKEGRHLPEYPEYAALHAQLVRALAPISVEEMFAIDKFIQDAWRVRRSFRIELSLTEKDNYGMDSPGMPNVLRYASMADRQFAMSYARLQEISSRKQTARLTDVVPAAPDLNGDEQVSPEATVTGAEVFDSPPATTHPEAGTHAEGSSPEQEACSAADRDSVRSAEAAAGANPTPAAADGLNSTG